MVMQKNMLVASFFLLVVCMSFASAAVNLDIPLPTSLGNSYGTFRVGNNITLLQTCTNQTAFCDECNLTSLKYDGDILTVTNVEMTQNAALFNYTLDGSFTQRTGHYTITGFCIGGGVYSPFAYTFEVTLTGEDKSSFNTIVSITFAIFMILFVMLIILGLVFKNPTYKIFMFGLAGLMLITIMGTIISLLNTGISNFIPIILSMYILFLILFGIGVIGLIIYLIYIAVSGWNKLRGRVSEEEE
jgi:hypothetical protein